MNVSHEDGEIEQDEKQMIYNVFDLDDTQAKDIMVPRVDMVSIDINASFRISWKSTGKKNSHAIRYMKIAMIM